MLRTKTSPQWPQDHVPFQLGPTKCQCKRCQVCVSLGRKFQIWNTNTVGEGGGGGKKANELAKDLSGWHSNCANSYSSWQLFRFLHPRWFRTLKGITSTLNWSQKQSGIQWSTRIVWSQRCLPISSLAPYSELAGDSGRLFRGGPRYDALQ